MGKCGRYAVMSAALMAFSACHSIDDDRIPPMNVYLNFNTVGDWTLYGVPGAGSYRQFIKAERIPAQYPYSAISATGFGGVLLVGDVHGQPVAYDLACPVECRADVRIKVNADALNAECPSCHSTYDIVTNYGYPLSGKAAEKGYGLQRYHVAPGRNGEYMIVTR